MMVGLLENSSGKEQTRSKQSLGLMAQDLGSPYPALADGSGCQAIHPLDQCLIELSRHVILHTPSETQHIPTYSCNSTCCHDNCVLYVYCAYFHGDLLKSGHTADPVCTIPRFQERGLP